MKLLKKNSFIMCIMLTVCLSILFSSRISLAQQADANNCIKSCEDKKQVCLNMNPDTRLCEAEYQDCVTTCKVKNDTSSSKKQEEKKESSSATQQKMQKDQTPK